MSSDTSFDRREAKILAWIEKHKHRNWSLWIRVYSVIMVLLALGLVATLFGPTSGGNRIKDAQALLVPILIFAFLIHNCILCRLISKLANRRDG